MGQRAANGTKATQCSFWATMRRPVGQFAGDHLSKQVAAGPLPIGLHGADRGRGLGGDKRVGVDLAVRVGQRDTDLHATVFEAEHLLDTGQRGQRRGAVGPRLDHRPHPTGGQGREGGVVVGGEAHHLAATVAVPGVEQAAAGCHGAVAGKGRETVLENHDIVIGGGDLALVRRCGGAQRAGVGGRVVGAGLSVSGDADPLAQQCVVPHLGTGKHRRQIPRIVENPDGIRCFVEVDELAAIGHAGGDPGEGVRGR